MVLKRIFLILILPIFICAQWTDPRPRSVQLWHMAEGVIDSLTVSAFYADTSEAKGTTLSENVGGLIRVNGFTSSSNYGAGLFLITNTSYTPDGANVFNLNSGSNQLVRLNDPIVSDTTKLKTLPPVFNNVFLSSKSSTDSTSSGYFVRFDSSKVVDAYGGSNGWLYGKGSVFYNSSETGELWVRNDLLSGYQLDIRWFGAVPDVKTANQAAANTIAIQNAVDFSYYNTGFQVIIPEGKFWVSKSNPGSSFCIDIKSGVKLSGIRYRSDTVSGSCIALYDTQNCTVFEDSTMQSLSDWWHWAAIEDIVIDCNGTNNTTKAQAINLYQSGETSVIRNITIRDYFGSAIELRGSHAPLFLDNIQLGPNSSASYNPYDEERVGIFINGGNGTMNFKRISGDDNIPMLLARKSAPTLYIDGLKIEGTGYSQTDSSMVIWADSLDGNTATIQVTNYKHNATNTESIVRVTQGSVATTLRPPMFFSNLFLTGAENFYITEESSPDTFATVSPTIAALFVGGNSGSAFELFRGSVSIPDVGSGITYYDGSGNADGFVRFQTDDVLHIRSPQNSIVFEEDGGDDLLLLTSTAATNYKINYFSSGLKIGGTTSTYATIDSSKIVANKLWFYVAGDSFMAIPADSIVNYRN